MLQIPGPFPGNISFLTEPVLDPGRFSEPQEVTDFSWANTELVVSPRLPSSPLQWCVVTPLCKSCAHLCKSRLGACVRLAGLLARTGGAELPHRAGPSVPPAAFQAVLCSPSMDLLTAEGIFTSSMMQKAIPESYLCLVM